MSYSNDVDRKGKYTNGVILINFICGNQSRGPAVSTGTSQSACEKVQSVAKQQEN